MPRARVEEPFVGSPPQVQAADVVECRDAAGYWGRMVAQGPARYAHEDALGKTVWLSVPVCTEQAWAKYGAEATHVNWPAEDVRPALTS